MPTGRPAQTRARDIEAAVLQHGAGVDPERVHRARDGVDGGGLPQELPGQGRHQDHALLPLACGWRTAGVVVAAGPAVFGARAGAGPEGRPGIKLPVG